MEQQSGKGSKGLVGKWFHSFKDGKLIWQGQVLCQIDNTRYLIQLYSWLGGEATTQKVISIENIYDWQFYDTNSDMKDWSQNHPSAGTEGIETYKAYK